MSKTRNETGVAAGVAAPAQDGGLWRLSLDSYTATAHLISSADRPLPVTYTQIRAHETHTRIAYSGVRL